MNKAQFDILMEYIDWRFEYPDEARAAANIREEAKALLVTE